jgi:hypothetical protein
MLASGSGVAGRAPAETTRISRQMQEIMRRRAELFRAVGLLSAMALPASRHASLS